MKKKILKAVKLIGISVTASFAILVVIYLFETKSVAADDNRYKAVVEDVVEPPVAVVTQEPTVVTTAGPSGTGPDPEKTGTVIEETEEETEKDTETAKEDKKETAEEKEPETETAAPETEAPSAEPVQPAAETPAPAPAQPATEAPTPAPTQPETEAPTQAPAPAEQTASAFTSVVYKVNDKKYEYNSLEEAKAAINVPTLTDAEANAAAVANKATYAAYAQEVINLINEYRAANGLAALTYNDTVATAAMHRAAESAYSDWNMTAMENGTSKRHIRPNFQKASSIADYYGISGNFGENYARFQISPEEVVECWKASPAHNALLLSTNYTQIGVGVAPTSAHAEYGDYYWIANFN